MKKLFDSYLETAFKKVNRLDKKGLEASTKYYTSYYQKFLPDDKNIKIIDIGCGTGQFLYFLEKKGYKNYYGIDISSSQIEFCKKNITKKVSESDAFDFFNKKVGQFDLIVANDFLEHIPKDKTLEILEYIYKAIKPGAKFFIKVPNMSNPFGLLDRYSDFTHEVGFTELSLRQVLLATGFKIIKIKGSSYPLISTKAFFGKVIEFVFYIFLKIMFRIQGHATPNILDKDLIAIVEK